MNNDILLKILQLDSLVRFLDWGERVRIHLYREGIFNSTTPKILAAYEWVINESWEPPVMHYGEDRFQYFHDPELDMWVENENYLNYFPEYKEELNKLKF
ncbi:hypothetical protein IW15_10035 [Chryseobacterium soli]|uniref:Uncharacterized protein n=1 Tax=Chryseobacterium soli TaxID=445961 RepID=A0A086A8T1_9FLAO|nr:hypothetical protein [Chryseobacterium soli]KFF13095.1 hypothetical protein IW15_10035 [Chryseobacterium soli]